MLVESIINHHASATALNQHAYLRSSTIPYDTIRDPATLTRFRPIFQTQCGTRCSPASSHSPLTIDINHSVPSASLLFSQTPPRSPTCCPSARAPRSMCVSCPATRSNRHRPTSRRFGLVCCHRAQSILFRYPAQYQCPLSSAAIHQCPLSCAVNPSVPTITRSHPSVKCECHSCFVV
jgi:hypothetical protein